ncbi:MAG: acyltransferase [Clostridia bacterium]|nr:acyltransferase [Clostridia bacterium]
MRFLRSDTALLPHPSESRHDLAYGFRALAMLGVMWFHIWQQSWLSPRFSLLGQTFDFTHVVRTGYLFVDIFLLLSGFLMFLPYAKSAFDNSKSPSILTFYKKRAARILPPYYLCILILFISAYVNGEYYTKGEMLRDILSHLTLTHTFFTDTYLFSHLNVPLWTVAIEAQFYVLFPFIARAFKKFPIFTYCVMVAASHYFRFRFVAPMEDIQMYFNQLPAMLDVYANGMLASYAYVYLARSLKPNKAVSLLCTLAFVFILFQIHALFEGQLHEDGYARIRLGQMERRFPLSFLMGILLIISPFSLKPAVLIFSNPLMRFLSDISFEAYIWHTIIAQKLKQWRIPAYTALENPQMNNEPIWQWKYTILCFVLSLLLGAILTYAFEKPLQKRILRPKRPKEEGNHFRFRRNI